MTETDLVEFLELLDLAPDGAFAALVNVLQVQPGEQRSHGGGSMDRSPFLLTLDVPRDASAEDLVSALRALAAGWDRADLVALSAAVAAPLAVGDFEVVPDLGTMASLMELADFEEPLVFGERMASFLQPGHR